jgi:transposase InsO family protein
MLGIKPLLSSPYHPMGNGRVERLHSTLKACLRKLCAEKPKDWHRYLVPTLFALRELPSDRTGLSPFELLYGRQCRGPLAVLRDLWVDSSLSDEQRSLFSYVIELQEKLKECATLAAKNANISVTKYKTYFDIKSKDRQ